MSAARGLTVDITTMLALAVRGVLTEHQLAELDAALKVRIAEERRVAALRACARDSVEHIYLGAAPVPEPDVDASAGARAWWRIHQAALYHSSTPSLDEIAEVNRLVLLGLQAEARCFSAHAR